jgi:hypothetical protein
MDYIDNVSAIVFWIDYLLRTVAVVSAHFKSRWSRRYFS